MEKIKIFDQNLKALGVTNTNFNVEKTEELMREYTLSFSVTNQDAVFRYLNENTVFGFGGQYFDVAGIDGDSGENNITQISAEHISYRLADYTVPNGYSFVGTIREIAQDILNQAKTVDEVPASTVFSIGETADYGTVSFGMAGQTNVTAREALIAMSALGVEIGFDNFTVNLPERIGADNGFTFEFGKNLSNIHRTWQRGNGWNYDIKIADIAKAGVSGYEIHIGDEVTVKDDLTGSTLKNRIISYTECDDPSKNSVKVGVFIRDNASMSIQTDRIANNSVQQREQYNNVSIDHENGFISINEAGTTRVIMNGTNGFAVQRKSGSTWVNVNSLEEFGLLVNRLTSYAAKDKFYIEVGKISNSEYGLKFIMNGTEKMSIATDNSISGPGIATTYPLGITGEIVYIISSSKDSQMIILDSKNIQFKTDNVIMRSTDGSVFKRGLSGKEQLTIISNGVQRSGTIEIINGIITEFPGI